MTRSTLVRVVLVPLCAVPICYFLLRPRPYALLFGIWVGLVICVRGAVLAHFRARRERARQGMP